MGLKGLAEVSQGLSGGSQHLSFRV
ncbi:hypothetical protein AGR6A_Lc50029 [Agrobacterium sp. NCPPB 925]|nr:hypothetical protein AGR6A_Lc50029 [Agrobacterium sp. NCPPB 925]